MTDQSTTISMEDLKAQLDALKAENDRLKASAVHKLTMKITEKGGLSVYGLGRYPITLYKEQWKRLLNFAHAILAFIEENEDKFSTKESKAQ